MAIKLNIKDIMVRTIIVLATLFVCAMVVTIIGNFAWSETLGIYYTGHYRITLGDMMKGLEPTYLETHLSVIDVISTVFEIWF